jgi:AcrR family transcriptional regulator
MGRPRAGGFDQATTERLRAAAEDVFGRQGFAAARLEDIAKAAGIQRSSLLYHFDSKQALYEAVVTGVFERLAAALLAPLSAPGSFSDRLDAAVLEYVGFLKAHPAVSRLILRELLDGDGPGHTLLREQGTGLLKQVERWVRRAAGKSLRARLPLRAALLEVAFGAMVREAAGDLREPLWGKADPARALARALFLQPPSETEE